MSEILWFLIGVAVGTVYHAYIHAWVKERLGRIRPNSYGE